MQCVYSKGVTTRSRALEATDDPHWSPADQSLGNWLREGLHYVSDTHSPAFKATLTVDSTFNVLNLWSTIFAAGLGEAWWCRSHHLPLRAE